MQVRIDDNGPKSGNLVRAELYIDGDHFADLLDPTLHSTKRASSQKWEKCVEIIRKALEEAK